MNRSTESASFRVWAPDFGQQPEIWVGVPEDLAYGRRLLPWLAGFRQELYAEGMSRKTFTQYRDNLWLLAMSWRYGNGPGSIS